MRTGRTVALLIVLAISTVACGVEVSVTTERADQIGATPPVVTPSTDDPTGPVTTDPGPNDPEPNDPEPNDPDPSASTVPSNPAPGTQFDPAAIDFGPDKPAHDYDEFLLAVMTDLEIWWSEQYPAVYGETFEPLEGEVYAAYPGRPDDLPGCGTPRTTYQEVREFVAFYCGQGDFMVYDDGDDGLLAELATAYGAGTIGTVLAHEYGHAIQLRSGALDRALPTILTEQQADCFAGAWTSRVSRGESTIVAYSDGDVRAGLIAMTQVSDPVGLDQFEAGGHGSAFDRVGAFQVGFLQGASRCSEILDDPLPLVPNEFTSFAEEASGGDAAFGYGENELGQFIPEDLNMYWDEELAAELPDMDPLDLTVVQSADTVECDDLEGRLDDGAALCPSTGEVLFNEPVAFDRWDTFGDFAVGYLLGSAWSAAVQDSLDTGFEGEQRALLNDCLTGAWVKTVIPVDYQLPQPRLDGREVRASAGDLDEAIQTVILVSDTDSDDDVVGSAFEKIDAFRQGVLGGLDACLPEL